MNNSMKKAVYDFAILLEDNYFAYLCKCIIFLRKYLKETPFLDRSMNHIKIKDPLLGNPNINFSTYLKHFNTKFSLQKKKNPIFLI